MINQTQKDSLKEIVSKGAAYAVSSILKVTIREVVGSLFEQLLKLTM